MWLIILLLTVLFVTRSPLDNNTNYFNSTNPDFVWWNSFQVLFIYYIIPRLYCCKNFEIPKHLLLIWTDHQQSSTWSSAHVGLNSCSSTSHYHTWRATATWTIMMNWLCHVPSHIYLIGMLTKYINIGNL